MAGRERKPPEPWQKEDAKRLKKLFDARDPRMSQEQFGENFQVGTQGAVHQYLRGLIPLNLDTAVKFCHGLDCYLDDFSPTLAEQARVICAAVRAGEHMVTAQEMRDLVLPHRRAPAAAKEVILAALAPFKKSQAKSNER